MDIFLGWIIFSIIVGFIGSGRKIGFTSAFLVSLLLSPIIGLIITLFSKTKGDQAYQAKILRAQEEQQEALNRLSEIEVKNSNNSIADELLKLKDLLDQNLITRNEFDDLKSKLISGSQKGDLKGDSYDTNMDLDILKNKVKEDEFIIRNKDTNEYKIINKSEHETAIELDLAKYYIILEDVIEKDNYANDNNSTNSTEAFEKDSINESKFDRDLDIGKNKYDNKKIVSIIIASIILFLILVIVIKNQIVENSEKEADVSTSAPFSEKKVDNLDVYGIEGKDIIVRKGPGKKFDQVLNKKTSKILKKDIYVHVDYTVKVIIEETEGEWAKIRVVNPDYLKNSHRGWIMSKYIIGKQKSNSSKIELYSDLDKLRDKLSGNGIGKLSSWKGDALGWYCMTDYYSFGKSSIINGMQNNLAYYINGERKENANEVKIVLNINNKAQTEDALKRLNELSVKTLKSLGLDINKGTANNILKGKPFIIENEIYQIVFELDQSKIETWNLSIYSK